MPDVKRNVRLVTEQHVVYVQPCMRIPLPDKNEIVTSSSAPTSRLSRSHSPALAVDLPCSLLLSHDTYSAMASLLRT
ncbi:hypothetical protein BDV29DRAFT_185569 [Aspergillus leporis]|uniref:Uncharacterized protein n=1 Tax=Aspergillus leporis TaxID=41062 RepID=A0A5N5WKR2_9EURO|nr:hypothetical protein BDV29DRAFT_185569 [Aspergillus leporis]